MKRAEQKTLARSHGEARKPMPSLSLEHQRNVRSLAALVAIDCLWTSEDMNVWVEVGGVLWKGEIKFGRESEAWEPGQMRSGTW